MREGGCQSGTNAERAIECSNALEGHVLTHALTLRPPMLRLGARQGAAGERLAVAKEMARRYANVRALPHRLLL